MATYWPDNDVPARVDRLFHQYDSVIVVDDGSPTRFEPVLSELAAAGAAVIRFGENRGIAAALNAGARRALDLGAEYVATFDQDTWVPPGYADAVERLFRDSAPTTRIGVVASERINGVMTPVAATSPEGHALVREVIQSGMVVSAVCFQATGDFDEELFIDCVDTEFCARALSYGWRIAVAPGTDLEHAIGQALPKRPFGISLTRGGTPVTYLCHSPYRRYFITRNNIDLCLRYARSYPRLVRTILRREVPTGLIILVCGPSRAKQAAAMLAGFRDALRRRRGPMPAGSRRLLAAEPAGNVAHRGRSK